MDDTDVKKQNTDNETTNPYISVDEMARMLSIARVTAYQLTKTNGFPCFHIGKRIIIPLQSFHRWAEEQASRQSALFERM
jgi:excisionase family DNA binding protein